jgi:ferredoxin
MDNLRKKAEALLAGKTVSLVIGYEEAEGTVRPLFARTPEETGKLIFDERCVHNLALYFKKKEVKKLGKAAIVASLPLIRSLLQMASENQVKETDFMVLGMTKDGGVVEFTGFKDMEAYVASSNLDLPEKDREMLRRIESMTPEERMKFWTEQFSRCVKCYACRAACPMCFCGRCQVEYNQPQIITVEATPLGNLEWHFMRAMHLAGRCVSCGECGRACPMQIPVHLLTARATLTVKEKFGAYAGTSAEMKSVMSTFKPEDKEDFIQ